MSKSKKVLSTTHTDYYHSIVAVHGLGANPDWAWIRKMKDGDDEVHVNWLADEIMLPAKLPDSRIMTFSYESNWLLGAPKQRRSLCAIQLLTALDNKRKEVTTSNQNFYLLLLIGIRAGKEYQRPTVDIHRP